MSHAQQREDATRGVQLLCHARAALVVASKRPSAPDPTAGRGAPVGSNPIKAIQECLCVWRDLWEEDGADCVLFDFREEVGRPSRWLPGIGLGADSRQGDGRPPSGTRRVPHPRLLQEPRFGARIPLFSLPIHVQTNHTGNFVTRARGRAFHRPQLTDTCACATLCVLCSGLLLGADTSSHRSRLLLHSLWQRHHWR